MSPFLKLPRELVSYCLLPFEDAGFLLLDSAEGHSKDLTLTVELMLMIWLLLASTHLLFLWEAAIFMLKSCVGV